MARADAFGVLKQALKAQGMTYRDLAQHLGLSESGVKKMLTGKDLPLRRLMEICQWLGISAADVVGLMEKHPIRKIELTKAQEEGLRGDSMLFRIYWRLSVEGERPDQIRAAEKLTAAEFQRRILRLERLDLVSAKPDGRVLPRHQGLFRWSEGNPLVDQLNRDWSRQTLNDALKDGEEGAQRLASLKLSAESAADLRRALQETVDEFARRSRREEITRRAQDLKPFRLLVAVAPGRFIDR